MPNLYISAVCHIFFTYAWNSRLPSRIRLGGSATQKFDRLFFTVDENSRSERRTSQTVDVNSRSERRTSQTVDVNSRSERRIAHKKNKKNSGGPNMGRNSASERALNDNKNPRHRRRRVIAFSYSARAIFFRWYKNVRLSVALLSPFRKMQETEKRFAQYI